VKLFGNHCAAVVSWNGFVIIAIYQPGSMSSCQ